MLFVPDAPPALQLKEKISSELRGWKCLVIVRGLRRIGILLLRVTSNRTMHHFTKLKSSHASYLNMTGFSWLQWLPESPDLIVNDLICRSFGFWGFVRESGSLWISELSLDRISLSAGMPRDAAPSTQVVCGRPTECDGDRPNFFNIHRMLERAQACGSACLFLFISFL